MANPATKTTGSWFSTSKDQFHRWSKRKILWRHQEVATARWTAKQSSYLAELPNSTEAVPRTTVELARVVRFILFFIGMDRVAILGDLFIVGGVPMSFFFNFNTRHGDSLATDGSVNSAPHLARSSFCCQTRSPIAGGKDTKGRQTVFFHHSGSYERTTTGRTLFREKTTAGTLHNKMECASENSKLDQSESVLKTKDWHSGKRDPMLSSLITLYQPTVLKTWLRRSSWTWYLCRANCCRIKLQ